MSSPEVWDAIVAAAPDAAEVGQTVGEGAGQAAGAAIVTEALGFGTYDRKKPPPAPSVGDLKAALDGLLALDDVHARYERAERLELHHALFRVNELYNRVEFADLEGADPANRHAILHGVAKDYGELASIKLFCAVRLVHDVVEGYWAAIGTGLGEAD